MDELRKRFPPDDYYIRIYDEEFYLVECPRVQGVNAIGETETYLDENDEEGNTNKR